MWKVANTSGQKRVWLQSTKYISYIALERKSSKQLPKSCSREVFRSLFGRFLRQTSLAQQPKLLHMGPVVLGWLSPYSQRLLAPTFFTAALADSPGENCPTNRWRIDAKCRANSNYGCQEKVAFGLYPCIALFGSFKTLFGGCKRELHFEKSP